MIGNTIYFHFEILDQFVRQIQETSAPPLLQFLCGEDEADFPAVFFVICQLSRASARGETPFAPKFETFLQLNVSPIYLVSKLMAVVADSDLHF